jgi:hypothetical protein
MNTMRTVVAALCLLLVFAAPIRPPFGSIPRRASR